MFRRRPCPGVHWKPQSVSARTIRSPAASPAARLASVSDFRRSASASGVFAARNPPVSSRRTRSGSGRREENRPAGGSAAAIRRRCPPEASADRCERNSVARIRDRVQQRRDVEAFARQKKRLAACRRRTECSRRSKPRESASSNRCSGTEPRNRAKSAGRVFPSAPSWSVPRSERIRCAIQRASFAARLRPCHRHREPSEFRWRVRILRETGACDEFVRIDSFCRIQKRFDAAQDFSSGCESCAAARPSVCRNRGSRCAVIVENLRPRMAKSIDRLIDVARPRRTRLRREPARSAPPVVR